ncbi:hypothetical protein SETIT_4G154700v2 [Setaria italica]|uniref:Uncharacterized protein n=1 Tax=Setaria italica TaxID=4555 RepID=A0A368QUT9_SETIT|nr:hypothetical protein SETIT_4G154700v2 [Setaria italica]RCV21654.1 hypothetical protein SETIT_4G154700v2 [Setaria italica]
MQSRRAILRSSASAPSSLSHPWNTSRRVRYAIRCMVASRYPSFPSLKSGPTNTLPSVPVRRQPPEVAQSERRWRLAGLRRDIAQAAGRFQGSPSLYRGRGAGRAAGDGEVGSITKGLGFGTDKAESWRRAAARAEGAATTAGEAWGCSIRYQAAGPRPPTAGSGGANGVGHEGTAETGPARVALLLPLLRAGLCTLAGEQWPAPRLSEGASMMSPSSPSEPRGFAWVGGRGSGSGSEGWCVNGGPLPVHDVRGSWRPARRRGVAAWGQRTAAVKLPGKAAGEHVVDVLELLHLRVVPLRRGGDDSQPVATAACCPRMLLLLLQGSPLLQAALLLLLSDSYACLSFFCSPLLNSNNLLLYSLLILSFSLAS